MDGASKGMTHLGRGIVLALFATCVGVGGCSRRGSGESESSDLSKQIVGTWFAYRDNVIENMWTFREDGTCVNDGWPGDVQAPPYHLEGTYSVEAAKITVILRLEEGLTDTVILSDPDITNDRLVYSAGGIPVAFLRERTAAAAESAPTAEEGAPVAALADSIIGGWVAFLGGIPANTWQFNQNGTFVNEGWTQLSPGSVILKRTYQVSGKFAVTGSRVLLTNERIVHFGTGPQGENSEVAVSQNIVLYDVAVSRGRLVYTNEGGLPVAFRRGYVTPTEW